MTTTVDPSIFKAYDVRGIYGEQLDGDVAELLGRGFTRVIAGLSGKPAGELRLGLGRDMRLTAPEMAGRFSEGMTAEGAHVIDAGMVGTEMLYFLVGSRELDGGAMVTASHNPKAYTGVKMVREGRARAVGRQRDPGHPPDDRGGHGRATRRRLARGGRRLRGLPAGGARLHRPERGDAAPRRRRRRQRDGRRRWSARCSSGSGSTS